jgi:ribonuclease-3
VLELVVTDYLYRTYPDKTEGELTSVRAAVVNTNSLSFTSKEIGLNEYLLLSKGEAKDEGKARDYILANALEALIGAIYLDQGYESATVFITHWLIKKVPRIIDDSLWQDPKSLFQEQAQEKVGTTPQYKVLKETGPDHDKHFIVGVFLGEEEAGKGSGRSKQEAEREAALAALRLRGWLS